MSQKIIHNYLRVASICIATVGLVIEISVPSMAVEIDWATVGDRGNVPDITGFGGVDKVYRIGKYEVTNSQYSEFLNAVAKDDMYDLFSSDMETSPLGGIGRIGVSGEYSYAAMPEREHKPVLFVSFWDVLRFVNWLENGQPEGPQTNLTTEDGTYHLTTDSIEKNEIARRSGAKYFLPSVDEWYKAAYYHGGGLESDYWRYPTQSDEPPISELPPGGDNSANFNRVLSNLTDVGSYQSTVGPYGTYDQAGNAFEWNETRFDECCRTLRGGSWHYNINLMSSALRDDLFPSAAGPHFGFRVASVPEPQVGFATIVAIFFGLHWSSRLRNRNARFIHRSRKFLEIASTTTSLTSTEPTGLSVDSLATTVIFFRYLL